MKILENIKRAINIVKFEHNFIYSASVFLLSMFIIIAIFAIKPLTVIAFIVCIITVIVIISQFLYFVIMEIVKGIRK